MYDKYSIRTPHLSSFTTLDGHSSGICVHDLKPANSGNLMSCVVGPAGSMEKGRAESSSAFPASAGHDCKAP